MKLSILVAGVVLLFLANVHVDACCPVGHSGKPIVNADQTVIILWDAEQKKQHFIRKASFASEDQDFGFIIPSPTEPELSESGNDAFATLQKLTEPEVIKRPRPSDGMGCGCGEPKSVMMPMAKSDVTVLQEKKVAGYQAAVLDAKSSNALTTWLKDNGYAYSAELAAWAQPYVDQGWKFTALKVSAKDKDDSKKKIVEATALRMSFKTERPLFPYREPAYGDQAKKLNMKQRLLRIYFVADSSYHGDIASASWSGKVTWAGAIPAKERQKLLDQLKLPAETGPVNWYLTEYEDNWPYTVAAGDVYFTKDAQELKLHRQPIIEYTSNTSSPDATVYALAGVLVIPPIARRWWKRQSVHG